MNVIQTSKIMMRRGPQLELPGAPTSLSPLRFEPGLDSGEFGFGTDSGRLFIGHAPNLGQPNYKRSQFPYQNVEVLTEASTDTIKRIFNFLRRDIGASGYYSAYLPPNDGWQDVAVDRASGAAVPYVFNGEDVIAKIEYFVVSEYSDGNGQHRDPLRQGSLRILSQKSSDLAQVADDAAVVRRTDLTTPEALEAEYAYGNISFRVIRGGTIGARNHRLQYQSDLDTAARMYFEVGAPLSSI